MAKMHESFQDNRRYIIERKYREEIREGERYSKRRRYSCGRYFMS
jgi:hypothetical protein